MDQTSAGNGSTFCAAERWEQGYYFSLVGCWDNRSLQAPEMDLGSPSGKRFSLELLKDIVHLFAYSPFFQSDERVSIVKWASRFVDWMRQWANFCSLLLADPLLAWLPTHHVYMESWEGGLWRYFLEIFLAIPLRRNWPDMSTIFHSVSFEETAPKPNVLPQLVCGEIPLRAIPLPCPSSPLFKCN